MGGGAACEFLGTALGGAGAIGRPGAKPAPPPKPLKEAEQPRVSSLESRVSLPKPAALGEEHEDAEQYH